MTHATRYNRELALKYLANNEDATMNDSTCEAFYRRAFNVPADKDVDLETIEHWIVFGKGVKS